MQRGALIGATIAGVAGLAWSQWAAGGASGAMAVIIRVVGIALGLALVGAAVLRLRTVASPWSWLPSPVLRRASPAAVPLRSC